MNRKMSLPMKWLILAVCSLVFADVWLIVSELRTGVFLWKNILAILILSGKILLFILLVAAAAHGIERICRRRSVQAESAKGEADDVKMV